MKFFRILFLLKLVILSALTVNGSSLLNTGSVLCNGNGQNNQSNPKLCEAILDLPLDLHSELCFDPIYWYSSNREQPDWVPVNGSTDKVTLHINATSLPPGVIMHYKCSCSGDKQIFFHVVAKQGDPPTPTHYERKDGNKYYLQGYSPLLRVQDQGRLCVNVTSKGWPSPSYTWYLAKPSNSSTPEYVHWDDWEGSRCLTGADMREPGAVLCIFPTVYQITSPHEFLQLMCLVENAVGDITIKVNVTFPDMNTEGTPQWFLKPHEMQSYGEISVDANGTGTAYCGAYRDEVNTTVEYRLCVSKPLVKQLDLTACYLEPTAMYSDLVCYPCQPLGPGVGVNLEAFDLMNHVGMVTAGCRVTSTTINQTYACMAYRKNQLNEITSDYQLLGYFSFIPAVIPNSFSSPTITHTYREDLIIGVPVVVVGFLAICICCCLCFCCCCRYKRKVGKVEVPHRDPPPVDPPNPQEDPPNPQVDPVDQQQPGHQQPVQPPVQPDEERGDIPGVAVAQGTGDGRGVDEKVPLLLEHRDSAETGYHSTDQRPVATWPRGGNPKNMTATLTDSLTQHKVGEVNLQPTDPRFPGDKAMFYLPSNRKYDFKFSATNKTITFFTGQPMFSMSLSTKVGDTGRNLPIPDDIDELLPVDMTELIQFVPQMSHKWCEIGMYLELKNCVRELKDSHNTPRLKLITILDTWIESGRDVSWCRLVEVLEQPGVELGAVAVEIKQHLYEKFPQVPDNIDFLDPLSVDCLMQLAPRFALHWERVGRLLKFKNKVAELKRDSKLSDLVKMTIIFEAWSKEEGRVSWLNLLEALEEDKELSWMKAHIAQHLQNRLMRRERRQLQYS